MTRTWPRWSWRPAERRSYATPLYPRWWSHTLKELPLRLAGGSVPVLATWSPLDASLDILLPLGLVAGTHPGLVVDLDPNGPRLGDGPTLAELVATGPTRTQLEPAGSGSGFLSNGGVDPADATAVIAALIERWPRVVLRCSARDLRPPGSIAALPLLPEPFTPAVEGRVVYQRCAFSPRSKPDGIVLPIPRRSTVEALFGGRRPSARWDPWLKSVAALWGRNE